MKEKLLKNSVIAELRELELLTEQQIKLLNLYSEGCRLKEISGKLKMPMRELLLQFMRIGECLAVYKFLECEIVPDYNRLGEKYLDGWKDLKNKLKREIKNDK